MRVIIQAGVALAVACSAAACQPMDTAEPAAETTSTAAGDAAAPPARGIAGDTARARAAAATRDGRMYTPAGDSAIDHWLAARTQSPDDAAVATAIIELQPYLLIACEDAIARGQFDEARRLLSLMSRSTPRAPALPRLGRAIAAGEAEAVALAAREAQMEEEAKARADADAAPGEARAAVTREGALTTPTLSVPPTPTAPPQQVPRTEIAAGTTPSPKPPPPLPPAAAKPARATSAPALMRAAEPHYPMIAMHRGIEGSVEVAFTVQSDGSVANARVLSAQPRGVFERAALDAVARYRFESGTEPHQTMQTIHFRLPGRS